ncbi:MAG: aldehyde dehydrogenase family protein [Candidatus Binatia bacterium]
MEATVVEVEPVPDPATAVSRANDSPFGLQAGLFTRDIGKVDYAFRNLDVGGLWSTRPRFSESTTIRTGGKGLRHRS